MEMKTYDFNQVSCIVGGNAVTGFAEGDGVIKIEYDKEEFTTIIGANGEATRSKSNNKSAKVMLKLLKTSLANDILNGFYQADRLSNGGVFPFMLKDNNGTELHSAEQMWVEKVPASGHGENPDATEWTLRTHYLVSNYGGNV